MLCYLLFFTYNVFWGFTEHSHHICMYFCINIRVSIKLFGFHVGFFFFFFLRMGQKASWKFLFPGSLQKSQVIKNLEEETFAAGKIFLPRNLEAGFVPSLWLHLYCFSEEQAKTSIKKLLGNLFANWFEKFNKNKNRIAGFSVFILPALSYPFNFQTERANS